MIPPPDHEQRALATDPERSVIVQAPAGSGKTSLLVARYLRLLSRAERPEEVLAITFTRKAAGEMRARIAQALASGAEIARGALQRSQQLGWDLAQQPNRLKIQTIDSFAMTLVRQMPLSAGFDPEADLVEDGEELYLAAAERLFARLYDDDPLAGYIADFLASLDNDPRNAANLLASMLGRRDQWLEVVSEVAGSYQESPGRVAAILGSGVDVLNTKLIAELETRLGETLCGELEDVARRAAAHLGREVDDPFVRHRFMGEMFTTRQDRLRKTLTTREGFPATDQALKQRGLGLLDELRKLGHEPLIANLRHLPEPDQQGDGLGTLITLCIVLTLAVVELNQLFAARRVADFTQLILGARSLLGDGDAPTELALALDYRIRHLLVDEFQDTSISQFRLFEQLVQGWAPGDGNTFFAVGDPMQSIYRFRDAEVSLFFETWEHGIGDVALERVRLSANFRAEAHLVEWYNQAFSRILGATRNALLGRVAYEPAEAARQGSPDSGRAVNPAVGVRVCGNQATQIRSVVAHVKALLAADTGTRIAVLVRSRSHLRDVLPALRAAGVAWRATDIEPLLESPVVRDLLSLVRALADPRDRLAWFAVLRAPWVGLRLQDLELLASFDEVARGVTEPPAALSADGKHRLARLAGALADGMRLRDEAPPRQVLETVWIACGGADACADCGELDSAERLLEVVDSLGGDGLNPQMLERAARGLFAVDDSPDARLDILTIHKAKGLEFDHVVLPFLDRSTRGSEAPLLRWRLQPPGLIMAARDSGSAYRWLAREDRAREQHELQRLLYVACTRARESLYLFAERHERPQGGTLLAALWPAIQADASMLSSVAAASATPDPAGPESPGLSRLVSGYEWQRPARTALHTVSATTRTADRAHGLDRRWEVALGTLMHETLFALSLGELPGDVEEYLAARRVRWHNQLVELGVDHTEQAATLAELTRQLRCVLGDPEGRWLLSARRGASAETPLTGVDADGLVNVFVDRTFVDDDGNRWIVDYKSAVAGPATAAEFITRESARYRPQLQRYAEFARAAYDEPIRTAIYFTALPHLEMLAMAG